MKNRRYNEEISVRNAEFDANVKKEKKKKEKIKRGKETSFSFLPSSQNKTAVSYYVGILCRAVTAAAFVFGMSLFVCDALVIVEEKVPFTAVLIPSVIFALSFSFMSLNIYAALGGAVAFFGGIFIWLHTLSSNVTDLLIYAVRIFHNAVIERFTYAGLAEIASFAVDADYGDFNETELMTVGVAAFVLLMSILFVPAIIKRIKILYLFFVGSVMIMPVISYNIIRDNWGFAVLTAAVTALLSIWLFEKQYLHISSNKIICGSINSEYVGSEPKTGSSENEKEKAKKIRKEKRSSAFFVRSRGKDKDIESALRLETPKERKERKKLEKKLRSQNKKEEKKLIKAERAEKRASVKLSGKEIGKNAALGGAIGVAVFAISFLTILLPAKLIEKNDVEISFIDDVVSKGRVYVTAFITGNEIDLNNVSSYEGENSNAGPRSTNAKYPQFSGIKVAEVEAPYNTPVYLRTWIGTTYEDEVWTSATLNEVKAFRELFGSKFTPEMITENFYNAVYPQYDDIPSESGYKNNIKYGFITERVNVKRMYGNSALICMPSTVLPSHGILQYRSLNSLRLPYSSYFDGIWTSKYFNEDTSYSTISNVTSMKHPLFAETLNDNIEYYDLTMDAVIEINEKESVSEEEKEDIINRYEAMLEKNGIEYVGDSLLKRYFEMTDEEKAKLISDYETEKEYGNYVRSVYTQTDNEDNPRTHSVTRGILRTLSLGGEGTIRSNKIINSGDIPEKYYHEIIICLIDYLSENMEYSLNTEEYTSEQDASKTAVEMFLTETKRGYCVQYASSLALMLRSIGIPARYCEGYIVSDFSTDFFGNKDPLTRYKAEVMDYNAHAWVEVYYDSVGWVQYEATQPYTDAMYGTDGIDYDVPDATIDIVRKDPVQNDLPEGDDTENDPAQKDNEKDHTFYILLAIMLFAVLVILSVVLVMYILAKYEVSKRNELIFRAENIENTLSKQDILKITHGIFEIYRSLGMQPETGELHSEYAERISQKLGAASSLKIEKILSYISKEEFGFGMEREEAAEVAAYYRDLVSAVYNGLGKFNRLKFRYIKRII